MKKYRGIIIALLILCLSILSCVPAGYTVESGRIVPATTYTGNVTATGTSAGHIPYFITSTDLQNSSVYYDNTTGYVGIFNNLPAEPLDVIGDVYASGEITAGTNVRANGQVQAIGNISTNGYFIPASSNDASAPNNSIYYSTDAGKLVYKDVGGTVHDLY